MAKQYHPAAYLLSFFLISTGVFGESSGLTTELFVYSDQSQQPLSFLGNSARTHSFGTVTVNLAALSDPDRFPLRTTLPDGLQYDVFCHEVEWRDEDDFKWIGVFIGLDGTQLDAVLTVRDEMAAGILIGKDVEIQLAPVSGKNHRLVLLDPRTYSECGGSVSIEDFESIPDAPPTAYEFTDAPPAADGNTVIDVLIVYTAEARIAAGGTEQIELVLQNAVDFANQAYLNSSVTQEIHLVASGENGYSEIGKTSSEMLYEIRSSASFQALRDDYGADLVALVTSTLEGNVGGIGFLMTAQNLGSWFAPYAYSVNRLSNLHWTITHEMGHNMGLNHEPESAGLTPEEAAYPYAFGHKVEGLFRTIMSYSCSQVWCPRIQNFSNPNLNHSGEPIGIANERENWWALNDTSGIVADFRHKPVCGSLGSPEEISYPSTSQTGVCTISWDPVEPNGSIYVLQRSTNPSFSGATTIYSGSLSYFEQEELPPNTYYYRVRAENCDGEGDWLIGSALVVGEEQSLDNVEFFTDLPGNEADWGEGFLLIGEASSGSSVTFEFFSSNSPTKPASPFDTDIKENCSSGCETTATFTAPSENTTVYFWLDVSSDGDLEQRSLTVQVLGSEPQGLDNVEFSTDLPGNEADWGEDFLLIGEASSGSPVTFLFFSSTTKIQPASPFESSTKNNCSGGCEAIVEFTAPETNTTLHFWVEVSSNGDTAYRYLTVAVESGQVEPPPQDPLADLEILPQSSSRTTQLGHNYELGFEVKNNGPSDCHNVWLTMTLPEGTDAITSHPTCETGNPLSCDLGTITTGASQTLQVTLRFGEEGTFNSFLRVEGDETDPNEDDNEAAYKFVVKAAEPLFFPFSLHSGNPFPKDPYAGVGLFNPNEEPTDVEFTALDNLGQQLGTVMLSELDGRASIPSLGQTALMPTEIFDSADISAVIASGDPLPIKLFFMLGDYNLSTLDGLAGPLSESDTLHFPIARSNESEEVILFLFNSHFNNVAETNLKLYGRDGVLIAEAWRALQPQGSLAETLEQLFGPHEIDGYVKVVADNEVKGFELYSQGKGLSALVAQPSVERDRLIAPHYFATAGGNTELRLQNLGEKYVDVSVKGYTNEGLQVGTYTFRLPRREIFVRKVTEFLPIEASAGQIETGYLIIDLVGSFLSTPIVSGSVTFTSFQGNSIATLPLVANGDCRTRFLHIAQSSDLNMFTGLAILNLGGEPVDVRVRAYDPAGIVLAEKSVQQLAPGTRVVDLLSSPTFFEGEFQQIGGHIEVVSDTPVVIFALFGDYEGRFLSAIEGQPF